MRLLSTIEAIARKEKQASAAHAVALNLALSPGSEWHANQMSKEAARLDSEIDDLRRTLVQT